MNFDRLMAVALVLTAAFGLLSPKAAQAAEGAYAYPGYYTVKPGWDLKIVTMYDRRLGSVQYANYVRDLTKKTYRYYISPPYTVTGMKLVLILLKEGPTAATMKPVVLSAANAALLAKSKTTAQWLAICPLAALPGSSLTPPAAATLPGSSLAPPAASLPGSNPNAGPKGNNGLGTGNGGPYDPQPPGNPPPNDTGLDAGPGNPGNKQLGATKK